MEIITDRSNLIVSHRLAVKKQSYNTNHSLLFGLKIKVEPSALLARFGTLWLFLFPKYENCNKITSIFWCFLWREYRGEFRKANTFKWIIIVDFMNEIFFISIWNIESIRESNEQFILFRWTVNNLYSVKFYYSLCKIIFSKWVKNRKIRNLWRRLASSFGQSP